MKRAIVRVTNELGLHARPAAEFVKAAVKYKSDITVVKGLTESNAKSILNVLSMGIKNGTEIEIRADGCDEQEAVEELKQLVESGFGE